MQDPGAPGHAGMGGSLSEPGGCGARGMAPASPLPQRAQPLPALFPSYFPPSKPKKQPVPRKPHPWPTSQPAPPHPTRGWHRTKAPQGGSRGSWLGRAALTGAGTHLQCTFPQAEPTFLPKLSDAGEGGSFGASPGVTGTLCDECPQAAPLRPSTGAELPAPAPARCCHNLSHNENFNDPGFRSFPRALPCNTPPHPVLARGVPAAWPGSATSTQKYNRAPKRGSTLTMTPAPSHLQATVSARLQATALQPLFATESVSLVPTSLVLRPRQTAHRNPAAEPRAALVPFHTVKAVLYSQPRPT